MRTQPLIISYRSPLDKKSHFLDVDKLINSKKHKTIHKVYDEMFRSITAYDPAHVKSLMKVENRLYSRIVELESEKREKYIQKNKGWKAIVLAFLTLGIRPLVFRIKSNQMSEYIQGMHIAHSRFSHSFSQMQQRGLEKELYSKPKEIIELEKQRFENLDDELFRLNSIPRIQQSLIKVNEYIKLSQNHQVAYGHSLELQEQLKDTHHVINHGQNLDLMIVNIVARKLKQEFEPTQSKSFETLRHNTFLQHTEEGTPTIVWCQNQISQCIDRDHVLRNELISGDCVLKSTTPNESAIFYFAGNSNVAKYDNPHLVSHLLSAIICDYLPNQEEATKLASDLVNLAHQYPLVGGNLYSICVPKEKFNESCYFSKPFGEPLENQEELRGKIDKMQSGEDPNGYPQIRILTHKIRAEDGYHVILNSTFSNDQLKQLEDEISLRIQAALIGHRVLKLPSIPYSR